MYKREAALRRVDAIPCPECHGRGDRLGVFHRLPCLACAGAGHVQASTGQLLDTLATSIVAAAIAADEQTAWIKRMTAPNTGTPDNWVLRNNYRGD